MGSICAFLKGMHKLYCFVGVGNCVVSSKVSASIQSKEPGKSFLTATLSSRFPRESQNQSNSVLKKIVDKEWSSVCRKLISIAKGNVFSMIKVPQKILSHLHLRVFPLIKVDGFPSLDWP